MYTFSVVYVGDLAANEVVDMSSSDVILSYTAPDSEEDSSQLNTITPDPTVAISGATIVPLGTASATISGPATSLSYPVTVARDKKVPKKKRRVTVSDVQKAQTEVLELEKEKLKIEIENVKLIKEKLKMELDKMKAKLLYLTCLFIVHLNSLMYRQILDVYV